jgi:hypothetical protein
MASSGSGGSPPAEPPAEPEPQKDLPEDRSSRKQSGRLSPRRKEGSSKDLRRPKKSRSRTSLNPEDAAVPTRARSLSHGDGSPPTEGSERQASSRRIRTSGRSSRHLDAHGGRTSSRHIRRTSDASDGAQRRRRHHSREKGEGEHHRRRSHRRRRHRRRSRHEDDARSAARQAHNHARKARTISDTRSRSRPSILPLTGGADVPSENTTPLAPDMLASPRSKSAVPALDMRKLSGAFAEGDTSSVGSSFDGGWSSESSISSISEESAGSEDDVFSGDPTSGSQELLARPGSPSTSVLSDLAGSSPRLLAELSGSGSSPRLVVGSPLSSSGSPPPLLRQSSSQRELTFGVHVTKDDDDGKTSIQSARVRHLGGLLSGRSAATLEGKQKGEATESGEDQLTESLLEFSDTVLFTLPYFSNPVEMIERLVAEFERMPIDLSNLTDRQRLHTFRILAVFERWASIHFEVYIFWFFLGVVLSDPCHSCSCPGMD